MDLKSLNNEHFGYSSFHNVWFNTKMHIWALSNDSNLDDENQIDDWVEVEVEIFGSLASGSEVIEDDGLFVIEPSIYELMPNKKLEMQYNVEKDLEELLGKEERHWIANEG